MSVEESRGDDSRALTVDPLHPEGPSDARPACPSRFEVGTLLGGRYLVEGVLGRGGMGEVYRARDTKLGEPVALKLLTEETSDPAGLRQLLGEVRVARQITHPNVCRVHDVGEADGLHFMTMELIEGEDLGRALARSGPFPAKRAVEIARQVCEGLAAAHERGILHRDLKPANLLVDAAGTVRLADFGLAGLAGSATLGGTISYMAPELFEHGAASVQSDLYALGLVLYELFTGRRAYAASHPAGIAHQHREIAPTPPSAHREGLAPDVESAILRCLEKDPRRRPRSARAVAAELTGQLTEAERLGAEELALRRWPPPELPAHPYPVLLPYQHPDLLAGRDRDVARLERLLRSPLPIHGLSAPSGTGKSSLLEAGLVPRLRGGGSAVALDRHPGEPGLAGRLIGDLLDVPGEGGLPVADTDVESFVTLLAECEALAGGKPPILILDQLEEVLARPDAARGRATLGLLLAATCRRRPGRATPPCRWLLAYREEHHGDVVTWLADALADARREGYSGLDALPHDLGDPERFAATSLSPLGTPVAGSRDPLAEAFAVFKAAIEAPLALTEDGRPRYKWRFADKAAERLAKAFADTRLARPEAPLAPELQVVLAHLLRAASATHVVQVPENPAELLDRALEEHLRHAMEAAFPHGRGAARDRARALLALRELASETGTRKQAVPAATIERAIGAEARHVLERLAAADTRLLVRSEGATGPTWALSHDRMALAIARLVDEEGGRTGGLVVDAELLDLRRLVAVETALHVRGEASATALTGRRRRQIAACADALLWDDDRRAWWAACRVRHRTDVVRRTAVGSIAALVVALSGLALAASLRGRAERAALLQHVATGEPAAAFAAVAQGLRDPAIDADSLRARLRQRKAPLDVLESGAGGVPADQRGEAVLQAVALALPLVAEAPDDEARLAAALWALDYGPARSAALAGRAAQLRERALAPLRQRRPAPSLHAERWIEIPAGTFRMGANPDQRSEEDERPAHQVTISAFRALDHEVTNAEYRRLHPEHEGEEELPVVNVSWHAAYVYAAWLGGRLPTEAEWEYMAQLGCRYERCRRDGSEARVGEVAWTVASSMDASGKAQPHATRRLEPNPAGLHDLLGNVWEWAADWYAPYEPQRQTDPWGPSRGGRRVNRGGSFSNQAANARPKDRHRNDPADRLVNTGLRVVLAPR